MKTALITGGTVRLGMAIRDCLKDNGWQVIVSSHRDNAGADIVADLSMPDGAAKLYDAALEILGGIPPYALINNAALFVGDSAAIDMVNFQSPARLTEMMAKRRSNRGVVVNILDCRVRDGAYGKSKVALRDYTFASARHFSKTLRVNAVSPGPVLKPVEKKEKAGETLVGRPQPEDVAKAVLFLLDTQSVTGCDIAVDGGQHLL